MNKREEMRMIANIAERGAALLLQHDVYSEVMPLMMDVDYAHQEMPLDLDAFFAFEAGNFSHDFLGIYFNFNRETKQMDNCFVPRCAVTS